MTRPPTSPERAAPSCPGCGGKVVYDLTCHTYAQKLPDGRERFMACMPCDSAVRYMCDGPDVGEGYPVAMSAEEAQA